MQRGKHEAVTAQHAASLRSVGIEADDASLDDQLPPPSDEAAGIYRSAPPARQVFPDVVKLVKHDKSRLSGAYLLLVASRMEYGTTARAFAAMGVDREELGAAAQAEVDAFNA